MDNDFEIENFDELEEAFAEFDDFDENFELEEIQARTAILSKDNMIALLCLKTANKGGAICRVDPREKHPAVQLYETAQKAIDWYSESLKSSRDNGWKIVYDGLPLEG
jgi:hypothetical protein